MHVLQELVADDKVSKIHCVAIRRQAHGEPREIPIISEKTVLHYGDFPHPRLGISDESFNTLAQQADIIIHSGASRSFWDQYHLIREHNLTPTQELVCLATVKKIPIHFISSGGVLDLADNKVRDTARSVREFKPPTDGSMGYIAPKWASETYLENLSNTLGVPVHVHRVTPAPKESEPTEEMLEDFGRVALEMKSLPLEGGWGGTFDLIKVVELAKKISRTAVGSWGVIVNFPVFLG